MSKYPKERKDKYTVVRIPRGQIEELEAFLKTERARKLGYNYKVEVISQAVREFLENHQPRFEHINTYEDHATIVDYQIRHSINVYFKDEGTVWCYYCQKDDCPHINYTLELPDARKALKEKGWIRKR